jgi:small subunit ribosomal protein S5
VKATFDALGNMMSPRSVAARRGKKVGDIIGRREGNDGRAEAAT